MPEAPGLEFRLAGALDGLTPWEISASTWRCSETDTLLTRLASGETTVVARGLAADRLAAAMQTSDTTLHWSTTPFRSLPQHDHIVQPADLLTAMIDVLLPVGTLGLIVPHRQQLELKIKEHTRPGVRAVAVALAPQSDDAGR